MLRTVPTLPVLFFLLSCLLLSEPVEACRYNVRDVGFVDLGDEPYRVFLLVDDGAPTGFVDLFRKTARSVFLETNVRVAPLSSKNNPSCSDPKRARTSSWPDTVQYSLPRIEPSAGSSNNRCRARSMVTR